MFHELDCEDMNLMRKSKWFRWSHHERQKSITSSVTCWPGAKDLTKVASITVRCAKFSLTYTVSGSTDFFLSSLDSDRPSEHECNELSDVMKG